MILHFFFIKILRFFKDDQHKFEHFSLENWYIMDNILLKFQKVRLCTLRK